MTPTKNFLNAMFALVTVLALTLAVGCGDDTGPPGGGSDGGVATDSTQETDAYKQPVCVQPPCNPPGGDGSVELPDQEVKADTIVKPECSDKKLPKKCGPKDCTNPTFYQKGTNCTLLTCGGTSGTHVDDCTF